MSGNRLTLRRDLMRATADATAQRAARSAGGGSTARVSRAVLDAVLSTRPECRCDEYGLHAGMYVSELALLGSGCCGHGRAPYVCPALDELRRRYGR